jgi:alpha-mannosidase
MAPLTFHLIGNAHLDPVWLWDWREGLNEAITTSRTILDLMDEDGELTFMRGESALYEHIEAHDPPTFERIRAYVQQGRWDPVGGTVVQADTNLTSTETLLHSYRLAQRYFRSRFGRPATVAWFADSFGHSAGLPEVFAAAGLRGFAFTRPGAEQVPLAKPAFWWEGSGGSRVLAYRPTVGWYGCERDEMPRRLDALLAAAQQTDLENVGVFFGLGNHGGGPSRRNLADIRAWAAAHPEARATFSTLHGLIDALYDEVARKGDDLLPTHRGELNFCLRGCYSSLARVKFFFRKTEAAACRAERTAAAVGAAGIASPGGPIDNAWAGLAFNAFHDILPGSIIERAQEDQLAWLGGACHSAQRVENAALLALARAVDTSVKAPAGDQPSAVPILVWNPHPVEYAGPVEIEASLDYRPIWKYRDHAGDLPVEMRDANGKRLPFQIIPTEHLAMPDFPWRKRVVTRLAVPPMGWRIVTLGWVEGAVIPPTPEPAGAPRAGVIDNGLCRIAAKVGERGVQVSHLGKKLLGAAGLGAITVDDPYGSWGSMSEEPASLDLSSVAAEWTVTGVETLESGPERAMLWVRLEAGRSRLDLRLSLARQREVVDVEARLLWNERSARLKLVMPCGAQQAEFEVPGGRVTRGPLGEVPGGRWVRALGKQGPALGFASDALYNFDLKDGALRATVVRATRYSCDRLVTADQEPWTPATDAGELRFRFLLAPGDERLPQMARELEEAPVPAAQGGLPRTGSLMRLQPASLRVLALAPAEDGNGVILAAQASDGRAATPKLTWMGQAVPLSRIEAGRIAAWRLSKQGEAWVAAPASALD